MKNSGNCNIRTLIDSVRALHLSVYLDSPFHHSGGMMIVGEPGTWKTTVLEFLETYETALILSDVNSKSLQKIRGRLTNNSIRTLVFPELQKLYERDPRTALNVEGSIRQLVEEGYHSASFEDASVTRFTARAMVMGAMTTAFRDLNWERWEQSGFSRRFIWIVIRLERPEILLDSVELWERAKIDGDYLSMPAPSRGERIPNLLTSKDRAQLRPLVSNQPPPMNLQFELLCRIACVLRYYYRRAGVKRDGLEAAIEFASCLRGASLTGISIPSVESKQPQQQKRRAFSK